MYTLLALVLSALVYIFWPLYGSMAEDDARLGSALLDSSFINAQTQHQFWTPQRLNNGVINEQSYALTWRWQAAQQYAHHGGVSKGAMSWLMVQSAAQQQPALTLAMSINTTLEPFSEFLSLQSALLELFSRVSPAQPSDPLQAHHE
jgi:hypothetical protein